MIDVSAIDLLLMEYAAGRLGQAEALLVAAHLALNPRARKKVSHYEAHAGKMMCEEAPAALRGDCLSAVLDRIDSCTPQIRPAPLPRAACAGDMPIPDIVLALISGHCTDRALRWSQDACGLHTVELHLCTPRPVEKKVRLLRLLPGQAQPRHAHRGEEITLVLDGGYSDHTGHYSKGDIVVIRDPRFVHAPVADETGCVFLNVADAPLRFEDPFQRLMNIFWRM